MTGRPGGRRRLLIVNADDYGLTTGVSRGILAAHRDGIVTSTSVLAVGPAFGATVGWLESHHIGVGAHLAAVGEDPPLLGRGEIPTLVDRRGQLPPSWRQLLPRLAARRIDPDDLRREFRAQLECLRGAGLVLTHVDTHQHVHLWPPVADVVVDLAAEAGIGAMRVTRSAASSPVGLGVRRLSAKLARRARQAGLFHTDAAAGLDEAGALDVARLRHTLQQLAATATDAAELGTHPGEATDPDRGRYRWGYRWADELAALTSPATRAAADAHGFELGTYGDLAARVGS